MGSLRFSIQDQKYSDKILKPWRFIQMICLFLPTKEIKLHFINPKCPLIYYDEINWGYSISSALASPKQQHQSATISQMSGTDATLKMQLDNQASHYFFQKQHSHFCAIGGFKCVCVHVPIERDFSKNCWAGCLLTNKPVLWVNMLVNKGRKETVN